MTFDELNLAPAILKAVREQGYETPTPIQAQAIPAVLAKAMTFWPAPRPAPARPPPSRCPCCTSCRKARRRKNKFGGTGHPCPGADAHPRTRGAGGRVGAHLRQIPELKSTVIFGGVGMNPQIDRIKRAWTSWWPPPAACWTCSSKACWTCPPCRSWCSTKPTACWTWASSTTSRRCWRWCPRTSRACCSRPPSATRSASWPTPCSRTRRASRSRRATPRCSASRR
jgi:hypothetical protein